MAVHCCAVRCCAVPCCAVLRCVVMCLVVPTSTLMTHTTHGPTYEIQQLPASPQERPECSDLTSALHVRRCTRSHQPDLLPGYVAGAAGSHPARPDAAPAVCAPRHRCHQRPMAWLSCHRGPDLTPSPNSRRPATSSSIFCRAVPVSCRSRGVCEAAGPALHPVWQGRDGS